MTALAIDALWFFRDLLLELAPLELPAGSPLREVPIDGGKLEAGRTPPVVLLEEVGAIRRKSVGLLVARIRAKAFGLNEQHASAMFRELSALMNGRGPFVRTVDGKPVGLFRVYDETGPQPITDPDTRWDASFGVFDLHLADRPVA